MQIHRSFIPPRVHHSGLPFHFIKDWCEGICLLACLANGQKTSLIICVHDKISRYQTYPESERTYGDVDQHIQYLSTPLSQLKSYLPYLTQEDVDSEKLVQIEKHIESVESLLEDIKNDVRAEEFDRIATASANRD